MATETPVQAKLNLNRMNKVVRYLQIAAVAVLVVFAALIVVSLISLRSLDATIDARKQEIKDKGVELLKQKVEVEKQKKASAELAEKIKIQNAALDVYRSKPRDPQDIAEIQKNIEQTLAPTTNAVIPARIYVQIGSEEQRSFAARIAKLLQSKGYVVPGIQNVEGNAPDRSELRYYAADEGSLQDVKDIQTNCASWGLKLDVPPNPVRSKVVRPRHYEIWIGQDVGVNPSTTRLP